MGKEEEEGEDEAEEKGEQSNGGRKAATSGGCRLQARKEDRSGSFRSKEDRREKLLHGTASTNATYCNAT